jgi:hypothetical protein
VIYHGLIFTINDRGRSDNFYTILRRPIARFTQKSRNARSKVKDCTQSILLYYSLIASVKASRTKTFGLNVTSAIAIVAWGLMALESFSSVSLLVFNLSKMTFNIHAMLIAK